MADERRPRAGSVAPRLPKKQAQKFGFSDAEIEYALKHLEDKDGPSGDAAPDDVEDEEEGD